METLKEVAACPNDRCFDCGPADVHAECERACGIGAPGSLGTMVCALYPLCAILLGDTASTDNARRRRFDFLALPPREPTTIRA